MGLEIERRFLVQGNQWKDIALTGQHLRQGYLSTEKDGWAVRIRIWESKQAWLTIKKPVKDFSNQEFEYSIPLEDAELIWNLISRKVIKTRYQLNIQGGDWIVDCFEERNSPLIIAEVELQSAESSIEVPKWCFKEITGNYQWSNAGLANMPFASWPESERLSHHLG